MTPFMLRIYAAATGDPGSRQGPELKDSTVRPRGAALHDQVEVRSLAEQLVCEANAVLRPLTGHRLRLDDHSGTADQEFSLSYSGKWARVTTSFQGRTAYARLSGADFPEPNKELADGEAVADLIATLVMPDEITMEDAR